MSRPIVIIYHKDCTDGFSAAWVAWKKFGARAQYYAVYPRLLPAPAFHNADIYFLDTSIEAYEIQQLVRDGNRVMIIDHHASSKENVLAAPEHIFDTTHSGAVLAWRFFFPHMAVPRFLLHVEDVDLWKFRMPHTREIISYAHTLSYDFRIWTALIKEVSDTQKRTGIVQKGAAVTAYERALVRRALARADVVQFAGHKSLVVNASVLTSQVGHAMTLALPPIGIIWKREGDINIVSLRSDGTVDVSLLAQKYGGGGHPAAAGFRISADKSFPWKILKKETEEWKKRVVTGEFEIKFKIKE